MKVKWFITGRKTNSALLIGGCTVLILLAGALFGPMVARYNPYELNLHDTLQPPSSKHWFGTDQYGRDVLSRVLHGARISLGSAAVVQLIAVTIGVSVGLLAGYKGGWFDEISMRIIDILFAFPSLILALAISAAVGANLQAAVIALSAKWWCSYARLMRGQVLSVVNNDYVQASKISGASTGRILLRHVLPNSYGPVLVQLTMDIGFTILSIASLSFVGAGAQPPLPEWGAAVRDGQYYLGRAWWLSVSYGFAILITLIGFNLLGDGIAEYLDPLRKKRI